MQQPFVLNFPEKKEVFFWFDAHLSPNITYYPLVSGGPDSMLMIHCLFDYFFTKGRDVSTIIPIHIHHHQRPEADDEQDFLQGYFLNYNIICSSITSEKNNKETENSMRKKRQDVITKIILSHQKGTLLTGHNLSDRVETTFLHLLRGCKLPGILNMSKVDTVAYASLSTPLLRPLLDIPKSRIKEICVQHTIPFFTDKSNEDVSTSERNSIRKDIHSFLTLYNTPSLYWSSWSTLYKKLSALGATSWTIEIISPSIHWNVDTFYKSNLPTNTSETYSLLYTLGAIGGISQTTITVYTSFFTTSLSGWKWINGWYLVISHGVLYCIKKSNVGAFWEQEAPHETKEITSLGVYTLGDFSWEITDATHLGTTLRYAQSLDIWQGKRIHKWFINKKIPLLRRRYYPVLVDETNTIVALLPYSQLLGYI